MLTQSQIQQAEQAVRATTELKPMSKQNEPAYEPAFPCETNRDGKSFAVEKMDPNNHMPYTVVAHPGLTKREWLAGMALQGMIAATANPSAFGFSLKSYPEIPHYAVEFADALLAELEKP